jgi:hypothetical protein
MEPLKVMAPLKALPMAMLIPQRAAQADVLRPKAATLKPPRQPDYAVVTDQTTNPLQ